MRSEESRAVVRSFYGQVCNGGNFQLADDLVAPDHVLHGPDLPKDNRGPRSMKSIVDLIRKVSPDVRFVVEDEIAEEDKVVTRWRAEGTLAKEMQGSGSDCDRVAVSGISIFRVSEGKIKETWQQLEALGEEPRAPTPQEQTSESFSLASNDDHGFGDELGRFCCKYVSRACCY